ETVSAISSSRSTATANRAGTGSMTRTTAARFSACWKRVRSVPPTTSARARSAPTSMSFMRFARRWRSAGGWPPRVDFAAGMRRTVGWYLDHADWIARVTSGAYRNYYEAVYARGWERVS